MIPLSETHPTLWKYLLDEDEMYTCYQDTQVSKAIQSCTVDKEEHERRVSELDLINIKDRVSSYRMSERHTLSRVKEAIEKYTHNEHIRPRGISTNNFCYLCDTSEHECSGSVARDILRELGFDKEESDNIDL